MMSMQGCFYVSLDVRILCDMIWSWITSTHQVIRFEIFGVIWY